MSDNNTRFQKLFQGLKRAYQKINFNIVQDETGKYNTKVSCIKNTPNIANIDDHLNGIMGLGIYVLNEFSNCWFGVIDIDDYTIDHTKIIKSIHKNKLPLVPCRSKSGGMHLYLFCEEEIDGKLVKSFLLRCAGILELSSQVEFRPLTVKHEAGDIGVGITLPYYNAEKPLTYAYGENGPLTLEAFLDLAESMRLTEEQIKKLPDFLSNDQDVMYQAPPCLQSLYKEGVPLSTRNKAMFNYGIYAKMRFGEEHVVNMLHDYNKRILDKPLSDKEIETLASSVNKKSYFYRCNEEPICSKCNKSVCRTRQFGIGNSLIENTDKEITIEKLIQFDSDDPLFIVTVNGKDIKMTWDQLWSPTQFAKKVSLIVGFIVMPNKKRHSAMLTDAMQQVKKIEVPNEASEEGHFDDMLNRFFDEVPAAKTRREILAGYSLYEMDYVYFKSSALFEYFEQKRFAVSRTNVFAYLRFYTDQDKITTTLKIEGKSVRVIKLKRDAPLEDDEQPREIGF